MSSRFSPYELQDHIAAELARRYSEETGEPFFVAVGWFADFDLVSQSRKTRIEVKCDGRAAETGNLAIEYWNPKNDQPSGILATTANVWLHLVCEKNGFLAYEFDVAALRRLVIEEGQVKTRDDSVMKVISLSIMARHARSVFAFESRFFEEFLSQV